MTEGAPLGFGATTAFTQSAYMTQGKSKADSRWATHHHASRDLLDRPSLAWKLKVQTRREHFYKVVI